MITAKPIDHHNFANELLYLSHASPFQKWFSGPRAHLSLLSPRSEEAPCRRLPNVESAKVILQDCDEEQHRCNENQEYRQRQPRPTNRDICHRDRKCAVDALAPAATVSRTRAESVTLVDCNWEIGNVRISDARCETVEKQRHSLLVERRRH
jgi:hypothetical protein